MFNNKKHILILSLTLLLALSLSGCGRIKFENGSLSPKAEEASVIINADEFSLLDSMENLKKIDFSGSTCYEEILAWQEQHPDVEVSYNAELPDGRFLLNSDEALSIDAQNMSSEELESCSELLAYFPKLKNISFSSGDEHQKLAAIAVLAQNRSDLVFDFSPIIEKQEIDLQAKKLSFKLLSPKSVSDFSVVLSAMPNLKAVDLGAEPDDGSAGLSFEDIAALQEIRPDVKFEYSFSLYGREFSLSVKVLDLSHIQVGDDGELARKAMKCMKELEKLDMDTCGVSDEKMAAIRDDFPDVKVVWRIWFGNNYSVRTDVERILASKPGIGGILPPEAVTSLKYCTDVKYLDLGHNPDMSDISFVAYMPKLEVAILSMAYWEDASPLANCTNLEYLEIQTTLCKDITPLKNLKKLKHLNICYLFELDDISPLYELTELERLWIGCLDPVPQEQIDKMQEICPDCVINTTTLDPTDGGWRYVDMDRYGTIKLDPMYEKVREIFRYDIGDYAFDFVWNDPLSHTNAFGYYNPDM